MLEQFATMSEPVLISLIILIVIIALAIAIIPMIFFLLHLQKILNKCNINNRGMDPGMVWLNLIPLFNWGWMFYTIFKITDSLKAEFKERNIIPDDSEFSHPIGLAYCITCVCSIIPFLGYLSAIACLVLWIIYWVKTYKYSKQLD